MSRMLLVSCQSSMTIRICVIFVEREREVKKSVDVLVCGGRDEG